MALELLTDRVAIQAKPKDKPYRLADGGALYLYIAATGVKSWQYRYRFDGKPKTLTIGKYPRVSLKEARKKAGEKRELVDAGHDPMVEKIVERVRKVAASKNTFEYVAHRWVKHRAKRKAWSDDYKVEVESSLNNHLEPLMRLPVSAIDARVVAPILEKVEDTAPFMVEKVRPRLHAILDHAVRLGLLKGNPLPRSVDDVQLKRRHFPAVTKLADIGEILRKARAADPSKGIARAHMLLVYTAQRVSEVVGATWDEIDLDAGLWTIPRARMKAHQNIERGPHEIPLPPALLAAIREWKVMDGDTSDYLCVAPRDASKPVTPEGVEKFYRNQLELGGKHSPHSWRSAFSTICRDAGKDGDVIESQLDHVVGNKVAAAYDRAKRLELRRELMQWYEATLVAARDGAKVLTLPRAG